MSVVYFKEIADGREGTESVDERSATIEYTRTFRIRTNSNWDDVPYITRWANRRGLWIGSTHPRDKRAILLNRRFSQINDTKVWWALRCEYSNKFEKFENPLWEPAQIRWVTEQYQTAATTDRDGNAIVNSAGDPFDPPAMIDASRRTITIRKNLRSVPSWILDYEDAVNSAAFTVDGFTVDAGKAKVQSVEVSEVQVKNDIEHRIVTLTIQLRKDGWKLVQLDQGFREKNGAARVHITVGDEPISAPVPLDGNGSALADPDPTNVVYISDDVYPELDFTLLPLQ